MEETINLVKESLINRKETIRFLGYGIKLPDHEILEQLEWCEQKLISAMEPKFIYLESEIEHKDNMIITADGALKLTGNSIKEHLAGCNKLILCCATLSGKVDDLIDQAQKTDMLHALLLDASANAAIEELRILIEKKLQAIFKEYEIVWQFGIGYGDLPLYIQKDFLEVLGTREKIGVIANDSFILIPLKSITGFLGLREKKKGVKSGCIQNHCNTCSRGANCIYKRS